ncbi:aconitate hydratase [Halococcus sp. IIIV-5B]|uniref:aconitate hydratase n=1 Tax=Halococcus sp. IIIV-5B TaxID=2321230 RepID=UPI000E73BEE7|nr:aconitate hydratase [Halococcus sp. IIIV-5B]RJS96307.1 aconitate hydratase [Halococcus sp. IIIV-5B]
MSGTITEKIVEAHLVEGETEPGEEIAIEIDQTLTQDATGTMVMLELESMEVDEVRTELSAQYVDHNLIQEDNKNPDDHLFLKSACQKWGVWYSPAGNGVSHPVHQERFGIPGKTLLGSDSHTPAAGAMGMLAIGSGGLDIAMAMAGEPYHVEMPEVWGVELEGELPNWCSAKDVILELLRRHDVDGGVGRVIEYHGPGLDSLTAMDRHVIANMGTELGATSTVFPADEAVRSFLAQQEREEDFSELLADDDAEYHVTEHIDLSAIEPMIAKPSSPGNVVPVTEVAGENLYQGYIGSSANPGLRDFAVPAMIAENHRVPPEVSFDVNPTSRQMLQNLTAEGYLTMLYASGARVHQAGCNGCIGMGQAPASGRNSLRTVPRNFPGRTGTREDSVFLCSPETAVASALAGEITDPRTLEDTHDMSYPEWEEPQEIIVDDSALSPPPENPGGELEKGPNVKSLPEFEEVPDAISGPVLMKVGDDISTDEIMPAGSAVLPYRSNIPKISEWVFDQVEQGFYQRAEDAGAPWLVVGGSNYGQGSSREHAALAPYHLGMRAALAVSYARIHWQNLVNFGIVPLQFVDRDDYDAIEQGDELELPAIREELRNGTEVTVRNGTQDTEFTAEHSLSPRQVDVVLQGGLIEEYKN